MATTLNPKYTPLPQEICGIICQDSVLRRRDLHSLCSVSRAFRDESERLLYIAARLRGRKRIKSFCFSIIRRPYLALRMRKLMILMPPQMDLDADDLSRIMNALRLCSNLRDLYMLQDNGHTVPEKFGDAVQRWILEGHAFKLKKFVNTYFQPQGLSEFLKTQPRIETLVIKCKGKAGLCDATLPNLKSLDSSAGVVQEFSIPSWHQRNIQRLQFSLLQSTDVEELSTLVALTQLSDTLKSLSITRRDGNNGLDIAVLIACVATQLPNLKYLRIMDLTSKAESHHVPFLPFPLRFTKIETLVLHPPKRVCNSTNPEDNISSYVELRTECGRRAAVHRILASLATLKRLVIYEKEIYEYNRDLKTGVTTERVIVLVDEHEWLVVH